MIYHVNNSMFLINYTLCFIICFLHCLEELYFQRIDIDKSYQLLFLNNFTIFAPEFMITRKINHADKDAIIEAR
jgi:hypothetical protein